MLVGTPHWGEAVGLFVQDVRESLGYETVRFALRFGEDRFVIAEPGNLRPLGQLPMEDLESSELSLVLNHSADAIIALDADGKVRMWNHGATRLLGYSAVENPIVIRPARPLDTSRIRSRADNGDVFGMAAACYQRR